jgi:hypothetical protein
MPAALEKALRVTADVLPALDDDVAALRVDLQAAADPPGY